MANANNSLAHTKWMCKYHIVFTPKYRRKIIFNDFVCGGAGLAAGVSCAGTMNLQLQAKLRAVPDVPPGKVPENAQTSG